MKTLQISEEKALELYKDGSDELKAILEESFGKDFFGRKVTDRIKTYEDACAEMGIQPVDESLFIRLGLTKHDIAYLKLVTIISALNEGWVSDISKKTESRWHPYFSHNVSLNSFVFRGSFGPAYSLPGGGFRFCLKSEELSDYCGQQFLDLWKEFLL